MSDTAKHAMRAFDATNAVSIGWKDWQNTSGLRFQRVPAQEAASSEIFYLIENKTIISVG